MSTRLYEEVLMDDMDEKDYYPPADQRMIQSRIADMSETDNYDEYIRSFFQDYEEELFD